MNTALLPVRPTTALPAHPLAAFPQPVTLVTMPRTRGLTLSRNRVDVVTAMTAMTATQKPVAEVTAMTAMTAMQKPVTTRLNEEGQPA